MHGLGGCIVRVVDLLAGERLRKYKKNQIDCIYLSSGACDSYCYYIQNLIHSIIHERFMICDLIFTSIF